LLGEEQWQWLEAELRMPGPAVRLIGSSIAFASEFHGMEGWSLFPAEQRRLVEVLRRTRAEGVIFITGDVHFAELSRIHPTGLYPLYDLASSGLNMDWPVAPHNSRRLAGPVHRYNWGCVVIDWTRQSLELEIRDASGALALQRTVLLDELRIPAAHSDS